MNQLVDRFVKQTPKVKILTTDGVIQGFDPANFMFGYSYHAHMIPPFKPNNMLILGYGYGTIAELTRKIWGLDVKITCVDNNLPDLLPYNEYVCVNGDAENYVKVNSDGLVKFDYIVIDLYNGGQECKFIFDEKFVEGVKQMASSLVSVNVVTYNVDKLKPYYDRFYFDRQGYVGNQMVTYWRVKE